MPVELYHYDEEAKKVVDFYQEHDFEIKDGQLYDWQGTELGPFTVELLSERAGVDNTVLVDGSVVKAGTLMKDGT